MNRRWGIVLIILAGVALGALREFLFVNLNYQIAFATRVNEVSYAHSAFQRWVDGWDAGALFEAKWTLALAFMSAMLGLSLLLARRLSLPPRSRMIIAGSYVAIAAASLALHLAASWAGRAAALELVSVKLAHLLQYPVVLLFILLASGLRADPTAR